MTEIIVSSTFAAAMINFVVAVVLLSATPAVKDTLTGAVISSSLKQTLTKNEIAVPVTSLAMKEIEAAGLASPKDLAGIVPGLTMPDYGSSMTSTIYVRGIGSRMENPVIGLYIDDVPVLDKNCYDFSFMDIRRIDMLRGPQGTLYGRNAMLGVMAVETLSPTVWQGVRANVEYGSANSLRVNASMYKNNVGAAVMYGHSDGFYTNEYSGSKCDVSDAVSVRLRYVKKRGNAFIDNTLHASYTDQGGYPYRLWKADATDAAQGGEALAGGWLYPVNYNDRSAYKRFFVMDGLRVNVDLDKWKLSSVTSLQMLFDSMDLDQDFTSASMFTLNQTQRQASVTQEVVLRPQIHPAWWNHQSGVFAFVRRNGMGAPVTFLRDGISSLILDNANAYIPQEFGKLMIEEDNFLISNDFVLWSYNMAAYHESYFRLSRWLFTAGLRVDYEGDQMSYDSSSDIHFKLSPMPSYKDFPTSYRGNEHMSFFQILPKASVLFDAASEAMRHRGIDLKLTGSVSRGYKSGGFNTQIFSDILQNRMMNGMMSELGVYLDAAEEIPASSTSYRPESCTDYEAGVRFGFNAAGHFLTASATAYHISCRNQQITVFPHGKGTGRMMANAAKSRSRGVESELSWRWKGLNVNLSASFMDARFVSYDDGHEDYSGNRIPYSPSSSLYARAGYRFVFNSKVLNSLMLSADILWNGSVSWNESGTLVQPPYSLLGLDARLSFRKVQFFVRGENLTDTSYSVFYFKSVGNSFFQTGKPRRFNAGIALDF